MTTETQMEQEIDGISEGLAEISTRLAVILFRESSGHDPLTAMQTAMISAMLAYCLNFPEHAAWFHGQINALSRRHDLPDADLSLSDLASEWIRKNIVEKFPAHKIS